MSDAIEIYYRRFLSHGGIDFKPHQLQGVQWCIRNENAADSLARGGFIADEMGLGKTIMTIGLIVCQFLAFRRTLIVLPPVLLHQWADEIFRTTGHRPLIFHGSKKKKIGIHQLERSVIVLTTYASIAVGKRDVVSTSPLHALKWDRVVFDEAHHLRNKTRCFFGAKMLDASVRWLISGTPIQNRRRDFYNMCNVIGLPVSYYADFPANHHDFQLKYLLKRTKAQVGVELPLVHFVQNDVAWASENEKKLCFDIHRAVSFRKDHKLKMMTHARQSCILPKMLSSKINAFIGDAILSPEHFLSPALKLSSKLDAVIACILERKDNASGKIVFCHFRQEIDEIVARLQRAAFTNVVVFDARTTYKKRLEIIHSTQQRILIIQIQSGSEGLNLQKHFSEVYFVSPHWNPTIEDQAVARCHRIGQTKDVHVFRFSMVSFESVYTLDKYIHSVQDFKRHIIQEVM